MIFCYWSERDTTAIASTIEAWSRHFPDFRVIGDNDVAEVIERIRPEFLPIYERIAIPACRSDLARLIMLHEHGGLYVDCHAHPVSPTAIRELLNELGTWELILLSRAKERRKPQHADLFQPLNSAMFARKSSPIVALLRTAAMENISSLKEGPYSIWRLTGPGLLISMLRDRDQPSSVHPDYRGRVRLVEQSTAPVRLYVHRGYRRIAPHWSIRQQSEPLLGSSATTTLDSGTGSSSVPLPSRKGLAASELCLHPHVTGTESKRASEERLTSRVALKSLSDRELRQLRNAANHEMRRRGLLPAKARERLNPEGDATT